MQDKTYVLESTSKKDIDAEIRFLIATAKYDKIDLLNLSIAKQSSKDELNRILYSVTKVLAGLKKSGEIAFFLKSDQMDEDSREVNYLKNKFSSIDTALINSVDVFVML